MDINEQIIKAKKQLAIQGEDGNWNYDPYMHGLYNGLEVALATIENREPVFREAPLKWLSNKYKTIEPS